MIKKITELPDKEQMLRLSEYAFNYSGSPDRNERLLKSMESTDNWGAMTNNLLTSHMMSFPFEVNINGKIMKMAGIGNVASYPEYRGNGGIRQLFNSVFEDLREKKVLLSYLAPFSQEFYRKFGYEVVFETVDCLVSSSDITKLPIEKTGYIRRVDKKDPKWRAVIKKLYDNSLALAHGSVQREDWWWETKLSYRKIHEVAVSFDDQDNPTGYLLYEMNGSEMVIHEASYQTIQTARKLASFVASHSGTFETFRYQASLNNKLSLLFPDTRVVKQTIEQGMMVKIVSFDYFLEHYPFKNGSDLNISIAVEDQSCTWNHGTWQLIIKNNQTSIVKLSNTPEKDADLIGSIQSWTQVLMSHSSLETHTFLETIKVNNLENSLLMKERLNDAQPALYDYF
ncbi:GNAT family N-acetyltransferase [Vagococcus intermedius]|uniref:GNAT family N-acetyltransferase n=1 Tax=Vagococcus intermedius TaxID=2991418 RepID=A0AAF0I6G5_9ENTE|nr:GNAT family N-acetyltransferase [Vagococcus intermedius]WEG72391.1 GNAT family N-acetyltransferase [Vagococcus intermedius]WEG74479.1 GNAT family N-acetyltransferase [Vagococcus intermedius]